MCHSLYKKLQALHTKECKTKPIMRGEKQKVQGAKGYQDPRLKIYRTVNFQILLGSSIIREEQGIILFPQTLTQGSVMSC